MAGTQAGPESRRRRPSRLISYASERRLLQGAVLLGGLVPVGAGLWGALIGAGFVGAEVDASPGSRSLDSHMRYLSGLLLGIGLGFWHAVPSIERRTARARLLTGFVVVGGLARLLGAGLHGAPPAPMLFGLGMELVVTPLICLWQGRVARRYEAL